MTELQILEMLTYIRNLLGIIVGVLLMIWVTIMRDKR